MTRQNLDSSAQSPANPHALFNPTFAAATGTGVQWTNTGREVLEIINGATASNYTINIGTTILGQAVTPFGPTALPTNNTTPQRLGPFPVQYNQPDGTLQIDLSSVATVTVALVRPLGA